jgi:hypothetical protein
MSSSVDVNQAIVKYGFIYEYLFHQDAIWRMLVQQLKQKIISTTQITISKSFHSIPMENILLILSYMDAKSLSRFGQTCILYREPTLLDFYWDQLLLTDYNISVKAFKSKSKFIITGSRTAKYLYIKSYMKFREILFSTRGTVSLPTISIEGNFLQSIAVN